MPGTGHSPTPRRSLLVVNTSLPLSPSPQYRESVSCCGFFYGSANRANLNSLRKPPSRRQIDGSIRRRPRAISRCCIPAIRRGYLSERDKPLHLRNTTIAYECLRHLFKAAPATSKLRLPTVWTGFFPARLFCRFVCCDESPNGSSALPDHALLSGAANDRVRDVAYKYSLDRNVNG